MRISLLSILALGILLFGCTSTHTNLSSNIDTEDNVIINPPLNMNCEDKAKEIIPKYLILSDNFFTQMINYWPDETQIKTNGITCYNEAITMEHFRSGVEKGENVNYLYFISDEYCYIDYAKQVISKDGTILGYIKFNISPVMKEIDKPVKIEQEITDNGEYTLKWSGLTQEIKRIYKVDTLEFWVRRGSWGGDIKICYQNSTDESGEFECNFQSVKPKAGSWSMDDIVLNPEAGATFDKESIILKPDIYTNRIYEIIEPNIEHCQWAE